MGENIQFFFKEKNSARYSQNNGQTINLIKKYLSQNRFVFHRSSDLYKKINSMFVKYREILKKLRGVNSVLYTELMSYKIDASFFIVSICVPVYGYTVPN